MLARMLVLGEEEQNLPGSSTTLLPTGTRHCPQLPEPHILPGAGHAARGDISSRALKFGQSLHSFDEDSPSTLGGGLG